MVKGSLVGRKIAIESPTGARPQGLRWPKLIAGTLLKRYKRFMADVKLRNGHVVTAHCANSGSMKACCEPGRTVYLSRSDNKKRRLRYTWEMIDMPNSLVGVNTSVPNNLVAQAIIDGQLQPLAGYSTLQREVKCGSNSRLDIVLEGTGGERCFIEIKNCTLIENGVACFPDAVTTRGLKHLMELQDVVRRGNRGVIFFLIQRMDAEAFRPADHIDPDYGSELRSSQRAGVEIMAYDVSLDLERIKVNARVPCKL
jgi:sugar fermentation stimulation protein A